MSKDRSKLVTDDDLREVYVDLVDTGVPDDDELEELAKLAALTEEEKAEDWRAVEARLDAAGEAAAGTVGTESTKPDRPRPAGPVSPPADVRQIVARPRMSLLPLAAAFVLGVVGTLLFVSVALRAPAGSAEAQNVFLEPMAETDVYRGSREEGRDQVEPGRLLLNLNPPTAAETGEEPPDEVSFVIREADSGVEQASGSASYEYRWGSYQVQVLDRELGPGRYEVRLHARDTSDDVLATYELVVGEVDAGE